MVDSATYLTETLRGSGLIGERFYPQAFPPEVETPFVVYNGPTTQLDAATSQQGLSKYRVVGFQLTIYAVYEDALKLLKDLICLFQDRRDLSHRLIRLDRIRVINTLIRYDPTSVLTLADLFIEMRYVGD